MKINNLSLSAKITFELSKETFYLNLKILLYLCNVSLNNYFDD